MPTQAETNVGTKLAELGLPSDLAAAVLQAVDTAGYNVADKVSGTPAAALLTAIAQRVSLGAKVPGGFIVSVGVPGKGWLLWVELQGCDCCMVRTAPVFVASAGGGNSDLWT